MEHYKGFYKKRGLQVGDEAKVRRNEAITKARINQRITLLEAKRNIGNITEQVSPDAPSHTAHKRAQMLAKWKAEKKKAMLQMKSQQKPAFKVGILQRTATGSPMLKLTSKFAEKNFLHPQQINKVIVAKPPEKGIITRSKAREIQTLKQINTKQTAEFTKIVNDERKKIKNHKFKPPKSVTVLASRLKVTIPESPMVLKRSSRLRKKNYDETEMSTVTEVHGTSAWRMQQEKENIEFPLKDEERKLNTSKTEKKQSLRLRKKNNNDIKIPAVTEEHGMGIIMQQEKENIEFPLKDEEKKLNTSETEKKQGSRLSKKNNDDTEMPTMTEKHDMDTSSQQEKENIEFPTKHEEKNLNIPEDEKKTNDTSSEFVPIYYSPYVNKGRGSMIKSPRRVKTELQCNVEELLEKEEKEFKCRIFSFRKYIECETKRLLDMCNNWREFTKVDAVVPEDVVDEVLSLCGKTTLLTSDKFMQFKDLIDKCEKRDPMIKIEDLQGFQDWVGIEVVGLEQAFIKLEERKLSNWKEVEKPPMKNPIKKVAKPAPVKKATKPQGVRSNIREHILAARKLKQNSSEQTSLQKLDTWVEAKTPLKTPRKTSTLLKDVLTSEAEKMNVSASRTPRRSGMDVSSSKRRFSGLEIIAATNMAKCLTSGETPLKGIVDEGASRFGDAVTPLKSILKSTTSSNTPKHCVQFKMPSNEIECSQGISEEYFQPLIDEEEASFLSTKMGDFTISSPKNSVKKWSTSTPIRKSARLAMKQSPLRLINVE